MHNQSNILETVTGFVVILISAGLLAYTYFSNVSHGDEGYILIAKFDRADGLVVGSDVKVSGINVGRIEKLTLDPITYFSVAHIRITADIKLPLDSSAAIVSESLMGGKYMAVVPGGDDQMLKPGEEIRYVQSSVILESLIGQLIFSNKEKEESGKNLA